MTMPPRQNVKTGKQLRGKPLEDFLVLNLEAWWASCLESGDCFVYSQSEFSKKVCVSRETIRKKQGVLDVTLTRLSAQRRTLNFTKRNEDNLVEINRLKLELKELKEKYRCLQVNYVKIFTIILNHGVDLKEFKLVASTVLESPS